MKKRLLILLFSLSFLTTKAQNWGGGIDDQNFNWGFSFQYVASELRLFKNANWREPFADYEQGNKLITDKLMSISSVLSPGFGIGFVLNKRLAKHFDLRSTPTLVFNDRVVEYRYEEPAINNLSFSFLQQKMQPTVAEIPLAIKLKSDRRRDFRAYMLFGAKYAIDLASGKRAKDDDYDLLRKILKNKKKFASYEAAIGFDFYFEYFKMSPEMKVSNSFGDVLIHEKHPYAAPLEKALLRNFTISLFFE